MKNRTKMCLILALTVVYTFGLAQAANKRPNILFILADDQSPFDLKTYDPKSPLDTPVLDGLAAEGMVFDGISHGFVFRCSVHTVPPHDHDRAHSVASA